MISEKLSVLSIASPYPGVSTTVNRNLMPRSSISTVVGSSFTVCLSFSKKNIIIYNDSLHLSCTSTILIHDNVIVMIVLFLLK